jgi:hypothetical protein
VQVALIARLKDKTGWFKNPQLQPEPPEALPAELLNDHGVFYLSSKGELRQAFFI